MYWYVSDSHKPTKDHISLWLFICNKVPNATAPWEYNIQEAYERKYAKLKADYCLNRGWKAMCYPFEFVCRGFVATAFQKWLCDLGFSRREVT